ncbi:MAG: histidine kinase [Chromatiaceae bacterium]|jgi:two-component system sensor histidine kinase AlgZ|nr:histidine kinase [Chromatiaceae bacterium]
MPPPAEPRRTPRPEGFLPDFCRVPLVLGVLLTAELLAIALALASPSPLAGFWGRLGPLSVYVQVIALSGSAALCLLRPWLARLPDGLAGLAAWGVLLALIALVTWGGYALLPPVAADLLPADGLAGLMVRGLGVGAIVSALLLRYLYLHQLWRRQTRAEAQARLQMLQARIRPHFLFNSLNTIASLIPTQPRLAEDLLQDLSDLFRAALADSGERTTLGEELELARRYLSIEGQRLGERLRLSWDLEGLPERAPLPPLVLQPLLENAVYHGIAPAREPGQIRVTGRYRRGRVNLSVRNTLPAEAERRRASAGQGIALDNVRQRMMALYPGAAQVIESRVEGDYQVRLVFPYPWRER